MDTRKLNMTIQQQVETLRKFSRLVLKRHATLIIQLFEFTELKFSCNNKATLPHNN